MNETQPRKGRGCFFYGCLSLLFLVLFGSIALFFTARYFVNKTVERFTDPAPVTLPAVELPAAELSALEGRVTAFKEAVAAGKPAEPLVLGERELNALIGHAPEFQALKGKVYVGLAGDEIKGQVSIPMDRFPLRLAKGRYLNGSAGFKVSIEDGVLWVTLQSLQVKGESVPDAFLAGMRQQNLAQGAQQDPQTAAALQKIGSLQVRDGQLTLKARAPTGPAEAPEP